MLKNKRGRQNSQKDTTKDEEARTPVYEGLHLLLLALKMEEGGHQPRSSSTSLAVIFHILQTILIEETDFKNEQFAVVHPGGAVGERLNK